MPGSNHIRCITLFTLFFCSNTIAVARQAKSVPEKATVKIEQKDGKKIVGQVEKAGEDTLVIASDDQKQFVLTNNVLTIQYLSSRQIKRLTWYDNPNKLGYFFASAAFRLKPGELYYKSNYVLLNTFHVGITNRISAGVSASLPSAGIICGNVKGSLISHSNFNFSGGFSYLHFKDFGNSLTGKESSNFGFVYAASTWGTPNQNITLGAGYLLIGANASPFPVNFMIAGTLRISKNIGLVSDNWFLFSGSGFPFVFSYALRWFNQRHNLDFGFINISTLDLGSPIGVPCISYTLKLIDRD